MARLAAAERRLADPSIRVLVVGEYKRGKSALVNALIDADVCPVDDDIATSVPTVVRWAERPEAFAVRRPPGGDGLEGDADANEPEPLREPLDLGELPDYASERGNPDNRRGLMYVDVGIPRDILSSGLQFEDTPGVGGLSSAHSAATRAALLLADAVLFVTDASQELTGPELTFLRWAVDRCPTVFSVLTKVDFYAEWERILGLNRGHLERTGLAMPMFPISTTLRRRGPRPGGPPMEGESGYRPLLEHLREEVTGEGERLAVRTAVRTQLAVLEQVEAPLRAERDAVADPGRGQEIAAGLARARERAERLGTGSAAWRQTMDDGVTDLTADIDFDLEDRFRRVRREAENLIDEMDPGKAWTEFESWLRQRMAAEISENYALVAERAEELAERVAEHFASAEGPIDLSLAVSSPDEAMGLGMETIEEMKEHVAKAALEGLGGSFHGTEILEMIGSIAGFAIASPVLAAVGLLMGGHAIREERERRLEGRREEAREVLQEYLDEVRFRVGKHSRDALRAVQRQIRDQFVALAEQLQRSASEALAAAQGALEADQQGRQRRLATAEEGLRRTGALRAGLLELAPEAAPRPGPATA